MTNAKARILIVDGDSSTLTTFRIALNCERYEVVTQLPNQQGLADILKADFSLIIVNQDECSASYLRSINKLLAKSRANPIIFMSMTERTLDKNLIPHPPNVMFEPKPLDPYALRTIVENTLHSSKSAI